MEEAKRLHYVTPTCVLNKIKPMHSQAINTIQCHVKKNYLCMQAIQSSYGLIDFESGNWIIKPRTQDKGGYQRGLDGQNLIDIKDCFDSHGNVIRGHSNKKVSVLSETKIMNDFTIYERMQSHNLQEVNVDFVENMMLVEAVAGAGKTHEIISKHEFAFDDVGDLILTAGREAAEDVRNRVATKLGVKRDDPLLRKRIRTIDSYLMKPETTRGIVRTLWIDEGCMRHFGDLCWTAFYSEAESVRIFGDTKQIPFINRVAGKVKPQYHLIEDAKAYISNKYRTVTYRSLQDTVVMLNVNQYYAPNDVSTTSSVTSSMTVREIKSIGELNDSKYRDYIVLMYLQREKDEVIRANVGKAHYTVHEFQGSQNDNILLVRTARKDAIFESPTHFVTAVTRHLKNLVYATTVPGDKLALRLRASIGIQQMEAVKVDLSGGYIAPVSNQYPLFDVEVRDEMVTDSLTRNKKVREFVHDHRFFDVTPMRIETKPIVLPETVQFVLPPQHVSNPIIHLQNAYEDVFPGMGYVDTSDDTSIFQLDELCFPEAMHLRLNPDANDKSKSKFDTLRSNLYTACPEKVLNTQRRLITAFFDCNGDVPNMKVDGDNINIAMDLVTAFVDTYIGDIEPFNTFKDKTIGMSVTSIEDWLRTQPPDVEKKIFGDQDQVIFDKYLYSYSYIMKNLPKPKLEKGADMQFISPQTIAHMDKMVNCVFCPIVKEMKKRLTNTLKLDNIIYTDMSVTDFEKILSLRLPIPLRNILKYVLEIDVSKYDKSQGLIALCFEIYVMLKLGFPQQLVGTWVYMHVRSRLSAPWARFRADVEYQRKRGDAMIFFGNTTFLMAIMAYSFDLKGDFCLFAGDDSLVFSAAEQDVTGVKTLIANTFNLEMKIMDYKTPYFCSKFLFQMPDGSWKVVPDFVKLVTKLGRNDLVNMEHVEEYRISICDNASAYGNVYFYPFIDAAIIDRYSVVSRGSFDIAYAALYTLVSDKEKFALLYYKRENDCIDEKKVFRKLNEF